ncbi:MAG: phosphodiester glycosidase family protein [Gemmatimonadaceae bacterium]|nr:phosphodiester glycosidase family protein [Gemmatimonadaceae bacterium]
MSGNTLRASIRIPLAAVIAGLVVSGRGEAQDRAIRRCVDDTTRVLPASVPRETVDTIAPGITYTCLLRPEGPWLVHVATIDLPTARARGYALDGVRAHDRMVGRERVSAMAARLRARGERALAAINADFFDLGTGEVENNHVVRGEWVKGAVITDSPHDDFDNAHTQFAVDRRGRVRMGRFELHGAVRAAGRTQPLVGVNYRPPRTSGLVLYTPWYGAVTLSDTLSLAQSGVRPPPERDPDATPPGATPARGAPPPSVSQLRADSARAARLAATHDAVEVTLTGAGARGDTLLYRVSPAPAHVGGAMPIPPRGAVLSATGDSAIAFVRALARRGTLVRVVAGLGAPPFAPRTSVGGWPRVVLDGANVGVRADSLEGTFPRFSTARHPRSAIALSRDSTKLMLVVVDGRRAWSVGMSLAELADNLIALGAYQAMNLDGGGSSALWLAGEVVNFPSDPSGERAVGNALVVRATRPDRVAGGGVGAAPRPRR